MQKAGNARLSQARIGALAKICASVSRFFKRGFQQ
jgi:hypothetical protein